MNYINNSEKTETWGNWLFIRPSAKCSTPEVWFCSNSYFLGCAFYVQNNDIFRLQLCITLNLIQPNIFAMRLLKKVKNVVLSLFYATNLMKFNLDSVIKINASVVIEYLVSKIFFSPNLIDHVNEPASEI